MPAKKDPGYLAIHTSRSDFNYTQFECLHCHSLHYDFDNFQEHLMLFHYPNRMDLRGKKTYG